ncbi:MAG: cytochrome c maturation protein CcmE [Candidatus Dormibacteraceae bacterium]
MWRWFVIAAILVSCTGYLIYSATGSSAEYYETIAQLQAHPPNREVRVLGVVENDIHTAAAGGPVLFSARQGGRALKIAYSGQLPEIFKPGAQVVVDGRPGPDGVFQAQSLQTKCPSKFSSAPPPTSSS